MGDIRLSPVGTVDPPVAESQPGTMFDFEAAGAEAREQTETFDFESAGAQLRQEQEPPQEQSYFQRVISQMNPKDMQRMVNRDPRALLPFLRDPPMVEPIQAGDPRLPVGSGELTRAAANVPGGVANIATGLTSMGARAGLALGNLPLNPKEALGDLAGVGDELGGMVNEMVRIPTSMIQGIGGFKLLDQFWKRSTGGLLGIGEGEKSIDEYMKKHGWSWEKIVEEFPDDPVGPVLMALPTVHYVKGIGKGLKPRSAVAEAKPRERPVEAPPVEEPPPVAVESAPEMVQGTLLEGAKEVKPRLRGLPGGHIPNLIERLERGEIIEIPSEIGAEILKLGEEGRTERRTDRRPDTPSRTATDEIFEEYRQSVPEVEREARMTERGDFGRWLDEKPGARERFDSIQEMAREEQQAKIKPTLVEAVPLTKKEMEAKHGKEVGTGRGQRRSALPDDPIADPDGLARYIRQNGGIWDEGISMKDLRENFPGVPMLAQKKGRSLDQWSEQLYEVFPDKFKTRQEAFEHLRDEWSQGDRAAGPRRPTLEEEIAEIERGPGEMTMAEAREQSARAKADQAVVDRSAESGQPDMFTEGSVEAAKEKAAEKKTEAAEAEREEAHHREMEESQRGLFGSDNTFITRERFQKAVEDFNKKGRDLTAGVDVTAIKEVVEIGAFYAEALARSAISGAADFGEWSKAVNAELRGLLKEARDLTNAELRKLWRSREVRLAKKRMAQAEEGPTPHAHGETRVWEKDAADKARGQMAADEFRRQRNNAALLRRKLTEEQKKRFKGLSKDAADLVYYGAQRVDMKPDGSYSYGGLVRSDVLDLPRKVDELQSFLEENPPGRLLEDGRMVGHQTADGRGIQTYRMNTAADAKRFHDEMKANSPEAAAVLDDFITQNEGPRVVYAGVEMPPFNRAALKERYGVEGLEDFEHADAARAMVRRAFGPEAEGTPVRLLYVPEVATGGRTAVGRFRNALRDRVAAVRRKKTGSAAEAIRVGELKPDFAKGTTRARIELATEELWNDSSARILVTAAEKIGKGETPESIRAGGYVPFSFTDLWPESKRMQRFLTNNRAWFEANGIDVPNAMDAGRIAGGKGWKVPSRMAKRLGILREDVVKPTNLREAALQKRGIDIYSNIVAAINVGRLIRPSTAFRNFVTEGMKYQYRVTRDLYRDALSIGIDIEAGRLPFQQSISDVRALKSLAGTKDIRTRLPPESMGTTFLVDLEGTAKMAQILGKVLRWNGFQYADIAWKRVHMESIFDASARNAWREAKAEGKTKLSQEAFVKKYKEGVPPEIDALAYREMDTWGPFDYDNIPQWLRTLKSSPTGRAIIPYPTYFYKTIQMYNEAFGPRTWYDAIAHPNKQRRITARANILASVTMFYLAEKMVEQYNDLPEDVKDQDLEYTMQRFGRLPGVGTLKKATGKKLLANQDYWIRVYDLPWIGEYMAYKGIRKGDINGAEWINDRLSLGPLVQLVAGAIGLRSKFNKNDPLGTVVGREVASWVPGHPVAQTARRLVDPKKRQRGDKAWNGWTNLFYGFSDSYPWMSMMLPEKRPTVYDPSPRYKPQEALLSFFLMNVRHQNEADRKIAVAAAHVEMLKDKKQDIDNERLMQDAEALSEAMGITRAGKRNLEELELQKTKLLIGIEITRSFDSGGVKEARAKLREMIMEAPKKHRAWLRDRGDYVIKKLHQQRTLGLPGKAYRDLPRRQRALVPQESE